MKAQTRSELLDLLFKDANRLRRVMGLEPEHPNIPHGGEVLYYFYVALDEGYQRFKRDYLAGEEEMTRQRNVVYPHRRAWFTYHYTDTGILVQMRGFPTTKAQQCDAELERIVKEQVLKAIEEDRRKQPTPCTQLWIMQDQKLAAEIEVRRLTDQKMHEVREMMRKVTEPCPPSSKQIVLEPKSAFNKTPSTNYDVLGKTTWTLKSALDTIRSLRFKFSNFDENEDIKSAVAHLEVALFRLSRVIDNGEQKQLELP